MIRRRRYLFVSSALGLTATWAWLATAQHGAAPWAVAGTGGLLLFGAAAAAIRAAFRSLADAQMISVINDVLNPIDRHINFHSMTHIKDLVHLIPTRRRGLLNRREQRWYGEEIIFNEMHVATKPEALGLRTT